jgi:hypothetical protein
MDSWAGAKMKWADIGIGVDDKIMHKCFEMKGTPFLQFL